MDLIVIKNVDAFTIGAILNGTFPLSTQGSSDCGMPTLEWPGPATSDPDTPQQKESKAPSDVEPPKESAKRTRRTKAEIEAAKQAEEEAAAVSHGETAAGKAVIDARATAGAQEKIDINILREACKVLSMKSGSDIVRAIISKYAPGKTKVLEIPEEMWPEFHAELQEAANAA